jgi:hypothetical protein
MNRRNLLKSTGLLPLAGLLSKLSFGSVPLPLTVDPLDKKPAILDISQRRPHLSHTILRDWCECENLQRKMSSAYDYSRHQAVIQELRNYQRSQLANTPLAHLVGGKVVLGDRYPIFSKENWLITREPVGYRYRRFRDEGNGRVTIPGFDIVSCVSIPNIIFEEHKVSSLRWILQESADAIYKQELSYFCSLLGYVAASKEKDGKLNPIIVNRSRLLETADRLFAEMGENISPQGILLPQTYADKTYDGGELLDLTRNSIVIDFKCSNCNVIQKLPKVDLHPRESTLPCPVCGKESTLMKRTDLILSTEKDAFVFGQPKDKNFTNAVLLDDAFQIDLKAGDNPSSRLLYQRERIGFLVGREGSRRIQIESESIPESKVLLQQSTSGLISPISSIEAFIAGELYSEKDIPVCIICPVLREYVGKELTPAIPSYLV